MFPISRRLAELHSQETHRAGSVSFEAIETIERLCSGLQPSLSMETGCGLTTIALSNLSKKHVVFAYDDREQLHSSVSFAMSSPAYQAHACEHIFGPTQIMLPPYEFDAPIDFALIDGPHGFPFPQYEYFYIFPHLRQGSILAIDDINIPHIWSMFACLAEDDMFSFVDIIDGKTGFLRRTATQSISPTGDDWYLQRHNFKSWPLQTTPQARWALGERIDLSSQGNGHRYALLGWSAAESWGRWSDGTEATLGFRWSDQFERRTQVRLEFLYAARGDVSLYLNDRSIGVLGGFPAEDMRLQAIDFDLHGRDLRRTNILKLVPSQTISLALDVGDRQLGIAVNHVTLSSV